MLPCERTLSNTVPHSLYLYSGMRKRFVFKRLSQHFCCSTICYHRQRHVMKQISHISSEYIFYQILHYACERQSDTHTYDERKRKFFKTVHCLCKNTNANWNTSALTDMTNNKTPYYSRKCKAERQRIGCEYIANAHTLPKHSDCEKDVYFVISYKTNRNFVRIQHLDKKLCISYVRH